MQETQVRSLGEEDPLEKEMTTHSSILAWRIPWTEEPGGLVCGVTISRLSDWQFKGSLFTKQARIFSLTLFPFLTLT